MLFSERFVLARNRDRSAKDAYRFREGTLEVCSLIPLAHIQQSYLEELLLLAAESTSRGLGVTIRFDGEYEKEVDANYMRVFYLLNEFNKSGLTGLISGVASKRRGEVRYYVSLFPTREIPSDELIPASELFEIIEEIGYKKS
jgi:hypothetical protein